MNYRYSKIMNCSKNKPTSLADVRPNVCVITLLLLLHVISSSILRLSDLFYPFFSSGVSRLMSMGSRCGSIQFRFGGKHAVPQPIPSNPPYNHIHFAQQQLLRKVPRLPLNASGSVRLEALAEETCTCKLTILHEWWRLQSGVIER